MSQSSIGKLVSKIPEMLYQIIPERVYRPGLVFVFRLYCNTFFTNKIEWDEFEWKMKQEKCARVTNLEICAEYLNNLSFFAEGPFEVVKGSVKSVTLRVGNDGMGHYSIEADSPELVVQVKPQWRRSSPEDMAASMMGSMMNSSTATDCAQHYTNLPPPSEQDKSEGSQGMLGNMGGEKLASFFDFLLMRFKVICTNITLKVEYLPQDGLVGTGLVLQVDRLEFSDAIFEAMRKKEKKAEDVAKQSATLNAKCTGAAGTTKTTPTKRSTAAPLDQEKTKTEEAKKDGAQINKDSDSDKIDANYKSKLFVLENVVLSTLEFQHESRTEATAQQTDDDSKGKKLDSRNVKCQKRKTETDRNLEALLDHVKDKLDLDESFETCVGDQEDVGKIDEIELAGRHVVPFVKFVGDVQMNFRIKCSKAADGNMMEIDLNVDSCQIFVSPRQVQILREFGDGLLNNPDIDDPSGLSGAGGSRLVGKPMTESDYQQVESDLTMEQYNLTRNLGAQEFQGWSSPPGPGTYSLDDEHFVPLGASSDRYYHNRTGPGDNLMSTSLTSLGSEYSMTASVMTTSTFPTLGAAERAAIAANQKQGDAKKKSEVDVTGETTHFSIHMTSLILVILHEDVMTVSEDKWTLSESVVHDMRKKSERFFQKLIEGPSIVKDEILNFRLANQVLDTACQASQLRFLVNKVHFSLDQKVTSLTSSNLNTTFEFSRCELSECLYNHNIDNNSAPSSTTNLGASAQNFSRSNFEHVTLLHFDNSLANVKEARLPNITIKCGKVGRVSSDTVGPKGYRFGSSHSRRRNKLEFEVHLTKCQIEADVTIVDRLSQLIYPQKVCVRQSDLSFNNGAGCQKMTGGAGAGEKDVPPTSSADVTITGAPQQQELDNASPVTTAVLTCSHLIVKLRFPIPDFREPLTKSTPYFQKSLRRDFLLFSIQDFRVHSVMDPVLCQISTEWGIEWLMMNISYCENENFQPIALVRTGFEGRSARDPLIMCRCNLKVLSPNNTATQDKDDNHDRMTTSSGGHSQRRPRLIYTGDDIVFIPPANNGPFSAKTVVRESDTLHRKSESEPQEMINPGTKEEISAFIKSTLHTSRIQVDIQLPAVSAQLPSKHLWETLYNRINNDLLLWEPSAPRPTGAQNFERKRGEGFLEDIDLDDDDDSGEIFSLCRQEVSTNYEDSDTYLAGFLSDNVRSAQDFNDLRRRKSSGGSIGSTNTHFTVPSSGGVGGGSTTNLSSGGQQNNPPNTTRKSQRRSSKNNNRSWKNLLSIRVEISRGVVCIFAPFRDHTNSNVLPALHGEFLMNFEYATFFMVHGYHGDPLLDYVSFEAQNAQLFHSDQNSTLSQPPPLKDPYTLPGEHMHPTIYKSEEEMLIDPKRIRGANRHMITVCVKVQGDHETHNVKNITVAAGFNKVTLNHKMVLEPNSWVTQLMDFFTVKDYPVPGYTAKENMTEMFIYFWDSGIVYNPERIPLKCFLVIGALTISTNLTEDSSATCLRFIAEDCALGLRKLFPAKSKETGGGGSANSSYSDRRSSGTLYSAPKKESVRLRRDYVNVITLGVFELSLKVTDKDKSLGDCPPVDLRVSNNQLYIRTCPDSAIALTELLKYLASYGDLVPEEEPLIDPNETIKNVIGNVCDSPILGQTTRRGSTSSGTYSPAHQVYQNQKVPEEELIQTGPGTRSASTRTVTKCKKLEALIKDAISGSDSDGEAERIERVERRSKKDHRTAPQPNPPGHTVHYFPGENPGQDQARMSRRDEAAAYPPIPQVTQDLGDIRIRHDSDVSDVEDTWVHVDQDYEGLLPKSGVPEIVYLDDKPIRQIDNYFTVPAEKDDPLKPSKSLPMPKETYTVCEFNLTWTMYDGEDFTPPPPPKNDQQQHKNVTQQNVSYAHSSHQRHAGYSEYSSARYSPQPSTSSGEYPGNLTFDRRHVSPVGRSRSNPWLERGGPKRDHDTKMDLVLKKVRFVSDVYPETSQVTNRKVFSIQDFAIMDRVQKSDFSHFLTGQNTQNRPRQTQTPMLLIKLFHVKTDPKLQRTEASLKVSFLPLSAYIDQDALLFLISFFERFSGKDDTRPTSSLPSSKQNTPVHQPPVMKVTCCTADSDCDACQHQETNELQKSMDDQIYGKIHEGEDEDEEEAEKTEETLNMVQENLILLMDDVQYQIGGGNYGSQTSINSTASSSTTNLTVIEDDDAPTYFRKIIVTPYVPIKLHYRAKQRLSLQHGKLAGLFLGLLELNLPELTLKRIHHRHGILGWDKLLIFLLKEWMSDIRTRQLGTFLMSVGPVAQVRQIASGIRDLILMPIEQYKKDGRFLKGLHRGASSFTSSTMQAALELTSRFIRLIQTISETAFDILSPSTAYRLSNHPHSNRSSRRPPRRAQPKDLREGISKAVETVRTGFHETAQNLIQTAQMEHENRGISGAAGAVIRQIPPTLIQPLITLTDGVDQLLTGFRCEISADAKQEMTEKYKRETPQAGGCGGSSAWRGGPNGGGGGDDDDDDEGEVMNMEEYMRVTARGGGGGGGLGGGGTYYAPNASRR